MLAWLESLTLLERLLLYTAVPATLILLLQTVLLLVGLGGDEFHDGDTDLHDGEFHSGDLHDGDVHDGSFHCDDPNCSIGEAHEGHVHESDTQDGGLHVLTVRGIVAFLTLFGWSGLLFLQLEIHWIISFFLAIQLGIAGMVGVALLLREALRLQYDGTMNIYNALGKEGTVYLTVPAVRSGKGKVNVVVQEQLQEFEAVTDSEGPIPTGAEIYVAAVEGGDTLVVRLQN